MALTPISLATIAAGTGGFVLTGDAAGDQTGSWVAAAGDVNGDGFDDIIIGAQNANAYAGRAYVVFGQAGGFAASINLATLTGSNGFALTGQTAMDYAGGSVASAGDVNGDGFDDLIVGAPGADSLAGQSYVVFGQARGFADRKSVG